MHALRFMDLGPALQQLAALSLIIIEHLTAVVFVPKQLALTSSSMKTEGMLQLELTIKVPVVM
jgi:hypothetical protein